MLNKLAALNPAQILPENIGQAAALQVAFDFTGSI